MGRYWRFEIYTLRNAGGVRTCNGLVKNPVQRSAVCSGTVQLGGFLPEIQRASPDVQQNAKRASDYTIDCTSGFRLLVDQHSKYALF
jgi:hypothetical protein